MSDEHTTETVENLRCPSCLAVEDEAPRMKTTSPGEVVVEVLLQDLHGIVLVFTLHFLVNTKVSLFNTV